MLDKKEYDWLVRIKGCVDKEWKRLTPWEQRFIEDILARFEQYQANMKLSPKQWEVISDISDKII